MEPKITYGGEALAEYLPPVLFPEIGTYRDSGQQRLYVLQMIDDMAARKDLCVTDMLAQPAKIRNLCGRIIFGIDINPDSMREERAERDLAPETMAYRVRLECITDNPETIRLKRVPKTVRFKRGVVNDPRTHGMSLIGGATGKTLSRGMGPDNAVSWSSRVVRKVDENVDYGEARATLPLRDAWICLSKNGEYCTSRRQQWLYREIDENGRPAIRRHSVDEEPPAQQKAKQR